MGDRIKQPLSLYNSKTVILWMHCLSVISGRQTCAVMSAHIPLIAAPVSLSAGSAAALFALCDARLDSNTQTKGVIAF